MDAVEAAPRVAKVPAEWVHSERAKAKKVELDFQNKSICDNLIKVISKTAIAKRAQSKSTAVSK